MTNAPKTPAAAVGVVPSAAARVSISAGKLDEGRRALGRKTEALREAEKLVQAARAAQTRQLRLWQLRGMSITDLAKATGMTRQAVLKRLRA